MQNEFWAAPKCFLYVQGLELTSKLCRAYAEHASITQSLRGAYVDGRRSMRSLCGAYAEHMRSIRRRTSKDADISRPRMSKDAKHTPNIRGDREGFILSGTRVL